MTQFLHREATLLMREVKLAHDTRRYRMTMQDRTHFQERQALESVADRMTEIQCLTNTLFLGIFLYDPLFHGDRLAYQTIQIRIIHGVDIKKHDRRIILHRTNQPVLDHLRITGKDIIAIQRAQEIAIDEYTQGGIKRTDLVLQPIEVDTRLTANRSIDGRHQGRRDIDRTDAPLESSAGKTTHIRNHTAAQIHQQGVTGSPLIRQSCPYLG